MIVYFRNLRESAYKLLNLKNAKVCILFLNFHFPQSLSNVWCLITFQVNWLVAGVIFNVSSLQMVFWDKVSLCSLGWPRTHDPPALDFQVLGLQRWTTTASSQCLKSRNVLISPSVFSPFFWFWFFVYLFVQLFGWFSLSFLMLLLLSLLFWDWICCPCGPQLLDWSNPPISASRVVGITGMKHCT
jgi:hypothetical protein